MRITHQRPSGREWWREGPDEPQTIQALLNVGTEGGIFRYPWRDPERPARAS